VREIIIEGKTAMVTDANPNDYVVGVISGASRKTTRPLRTADISGLIKVMFNSMPLGSTVRILIEVESPKEQAKPEDNQNETS